MAPGGLLLSCALETEVTQTKKQIFAALLVFCLVSAFPAVSFALDDNEFDGYPADTLTVNVGYLGGPYYEKAVFSLSELWAMDVVYADYTFIDSMPSVVIDHVAGIRLSDLMDAAGIDMNSIQTFYFWTNDKQSGYYTSYSKGSLIDTPRYCYYSLPDNFGQGAGNEYAASDKVPADTVIALADDWNRCITGASFGSDYLNLNTNTRFRLIFGQANAYECTASRSAMWIHKINVELGGAPSLTLGDSSLEGKVGSVLRTEAVVDGESAVLQNEKVTWSSSDESIASVDEDGNITIHAEGTAVITASFAGVSRSVTVNGGSGEEEPAGSGGEGINRPSGGTDGAAESRKPGALLEIAQPKTIKNTKEGGVQNWRVYEMSEGAEALADMETENPLLGIFGAAAAGLFFAGLIIYAIAFYFNVGRKIYVHKPKSE